MSKPNLFLDIDETLLHASSIGEYNEFMKEEGSEDKRSKFTVHEMDESYVIFERPGLQEFLDFVFENFNVSIWTAASKDYALFILRNIIRKNKPKRQVDWFFFSYHCKRSIKLKGSTKNLNMLWDDFKLYGYNIKNTVIIDDNCGVYDAQPNNCIAVRPFLVADDGSENDTQLSELIKPLTDMKERINQDKPNLVEDINEVNELK